MNKKKWWPLRYDCFSFKWQKHPFKPTCTKKGISSRRWNIQGREWRWLWQFCFTLNHYDLIALPVALVAPWAPGSRKMVTTTLVLASSALLTTEWQDSAISPNKNVIVSYCLWLAHMSISESIPGAGKCHGLTGLKLVSHAPPWGSWWNDISKTIQWGMGEGVFFQTEIWLIDVKFPAYVLKPICKIFHNTFLLKPPKTYKKYQNE